MPELRGDTEWRRVERLMAAASIVILAAALWLPTASLGSTAVVGGAYLWGESSLRCASVDVGWFVDSLEIAQHVLFAASLIAAFVVLWKARRLWLLSPVFGTLLLFAQRRAYDFDGGQWDGSQFFWDAVLWAMVVGAVSLREVATFGRISGRSSV